MSFSNHNKIDKDIKNGLAILQLIYAREKQIHNGKFTEQKDVFAYIENKYFNEECITRRTKNA